MDRDGFGVAKLYDRLGNSFEKRVGHYLNVMDALGVHVAYPERAMEGILANMSSSFVRLPYLCVIDTSDSAFYGLGVFNRIFEHQHSASVVASAMMSGGSKPPEKMNISGCGPRLSIGVTVMRRTYLQLRYGLAIRHPRRVSPFGSAALIQGLENRRAEQRDNRITRLPANHLIIRNPLSTRSSSMRFHITFACPTATTC